MRAARHPPRPHTGTGPGLGAATASNGFRCSAGVFRAHSGENASSGGNAIRGGTHRPILYSSGHSHRRPGGSPAPEARCTSGGTGGGGPVRAYGISKAALFPSFSISGFLGFQGSDVGAFTLGDTFSHNAFTASASPSLVLPFLNYGRLYNAVRAQDAVFQQSLVTYKQTVLQALQEAENAMSSFIRSRQRLTLLQQAAEAAGRSTKLALEQYNAGSTDFTTVVSAQTTQYQQENSVAAAAGNTALQAVALFRALGGGWQPQPLPLPKATIDAMKKRTDWGGMLRDMESVPVAGQSEIPQAETHRGY
ncbi:MAG: TolC family protein [Bilophila wadsworthia]